MSQSTSQQTNHVPADGASDVGRMMFLIRSALAGARTSIPVVVQSVSTAGGVAPIGTVAVQPLVSLLDGGGQTWPHGTVHNVPYLRIQGGANAVILDPQVGDIGIAVVCDRDISSVKASKGVSAPASARKHDLSDMVYLGSIISSTPAQYLEFSSAGITLTSSVGVTINGNVQVNGAIVATGNVTAGSIDLETHHHTGVQTGTGNTGGPAG